MPDVSVLVVDDQVPFRLAARSVIDRADGFAWTGETASGEEVIDAVARLRPDLVLMDVYMGEMNGIAATRAAVDACPGLSVILCSTYPLDELPAETPDCGAIGYIRKETLSPDTLRSVWEQRQPGLFVSF